MVAIYILAGIGGFCLLVVVGMVLSFIFSSAPDPEGKKEDEEKTYICALTDCWGQKARVTGAFFKNDWEKFKQCKSYPETKIIREESIPYFEGLSDDEFHTMKYGAKLSEFSDTEIAEEFNRRLDSPFHKIKLKGQAYIGK